MANKKITALTELSAGDRATTDVLPIVDISGTATTKKITVANLVSATSAGALSSYDFSGSAILGFDATLNTQTDSYTLQSSDAGKVVVLNKGSAVNLTVPAGLGAGFTCSGCDCSICKYCHIWKHNGYNVNKWCSHCIQQINVCFR